MCILAFVLILTCGSAFAQTSPIGKGSKMVLGDLLFSSMGGDLHEEDGDRVTVIQLNPSAGYFVSRGIACGGNLFLTRQSAGNTSNTTWGIGPLLMYFIGGNQPKTTAKGATYPFLAASFLYTRSIMKMEWYGEKDEFKASGTMVGLGAGICHMLSNTVALMVQASYQIDNMKPEEEDSESGNQLGIRVGIASFLH